MKRRLQIQADAGARHPFRSRFGVCRAAWGAKLRGMGITAQDVREFLLAYCACFLAVSLYIA